MKPNARKTLIVNGSPRAHGDTAALIDAFLRALKGEAWVFDAFHARIEPCRDCRRCRESHTCVIRDDMDALFERLVAADQVVIASPVYFSGLTGPLLNAFSRLQPCFYARRDEGRGPFDEKERAGGILLAAGGSGSPAPAEAAARRLLRVAHVTEFGPTVLSPRTDAIPAQQDVQALAAVRALAEYFNGR